jgi:mono/diheme cytochrome c family protein
MKNKILILATILFLASCSVQLMTPMQSDVDRVKTKFPDYTLAELNEGKALYEQNCGNCHGLKRPSSEPEAEWKEIVPEMVQKANRKGSKIDTRQQELILKYVITMSNAGVVSNEYEEATSAFNF